MAIQIYRFENGKRYDMGTLPSSMKNRPKECQSLIEAGLRGEEIVEEENGVGIFPPIFKEEYALKPYSFLIMQDEEANETIATLSQLGWHWQE